MKRTISRDQAWELLTRHNQEPFHLRHAETLEGVMKWFADSLGHGEDRDYWGVVGLLHDIDFERFPEQHCLKARELLLEAGVGEDVVRSVVSHGYGLTGVDVRPEHEMEKVLYAVDELTGLIWAAALMRPSRSVQDLELKSVKKKYKTSTFAAGCSREVIERGAAALGWDLDDLISRTILAMRSCEGSGD